MVKSPLEPPNILIVNDTTTELSSLTEILHKSGYITRPVTSARQAVSAIEAFIPDLILMDTSMPEIDGSMFCSMLKKSVKTRDIPIIFISALNTTQDRIKCYQAGAVDFIEKPYDTEELMLRINTHLRMYKRQKELELYNKNMNKIINDQLYTIYEEQKQLLYSLSILSSKLCATIPAHMDRLGKNSRILALGLQLSPIFKDQVTNSFVDAIEIAAPLHDIGKIGISQDILSKENDLSEKENEILKTHTTIGMSILGEIYSLSKKNELLKMAMDIARYHHENWDGSGYPEGLSGNDIPLSARIVSVVDAYDTYVIEKTCSQEQALMILQEGSGVVFDPEIITVFLKIQNQLIR